MKPDHHVTYFRPEMSNVAVSPALQAGEEAELHRLLKEQARKINELSETLREREEELERQRGEHDRVSLELLENSRAVAVLARNIDKSREETERRIAKRISSKILPIVMELKDNEADGKETRELELLESYVRELTASLLGGTNCLGVLTTTEMRVASMIKNGATSNEISLQLCISPHTVKAHRKSIRKKLDIRNSSVNLASFLNSEM